MTYLETSHAIDESRMDVIARQHDDAMSAAKKCYEDYKLLQAKLSTAQTTLNRLQDPDLTPVRSRTAHWQVQVDQAEAEIVRIKNQMKDNRIDAQILQERAAAAGALKDACIVFLKERA